MPSESCRRDREQSFKDFIERDDGVLVVAHRSIDGGLQDVVANLLRLSQAVLQWGMLVHLFLNLMTKIEMKNLVDSYMTLS